MDLLRVAIEGDTELLEEYQKIVEPLLVMKDKDRNAWKRYDGLSVTKEDRLYPISVLSLDHSAGLGTNYSKEEQSAIQVTSQKK